MQPQGRWGAHTGRGKDKRREQSRGQGWAPAGWESHKICSNHSILAVGTSPAARARCQPRLSSMPGPFRSSPAQAWAELGRLPSPWNTGIYKTSALHPVSLPWPPSSVKKATLCFPCTLPDLSQALGSALSCWCYLPPGSAHLNPLIETPAWIHSAGTSQMWWRRSWIRKSTLHPSTPPGSEAPVCPLHLTRAPGTPCA